MRRSTESTATRSPKRLVRPEVSTTRSPVVVVAIAAPGGWGWGGLAAVANLRRGRRPHPYGLQASGAGSFWPRDPQPAGVSGAAEPGAEPRGGVAQRRQRRRPCGGVEALGPLHAEDRGQVAAGVEHGDGDGA